MMLLYICRRIAVTRVSVIKSLFHLSVMAVASNLMIIFPDSYAPSLSLIIALLGLSVLYIGLVVWLIKCLKCDKVIPEWKIFLLFGVLSASPFLLAIVLLVIFCQ